MRWRPEFAHMTSIEDPTNHSSRPVEKLLWFGPRSLIIAQIYYNEIKSLLSDRERMKLIGIGRGATGHCTVDDADITSLLK